MADLAEITDPMERMLAEALDVAGLRWRHEHNGLDFYLSDLDLYIEVKRFHTDRISGQMARAPNVIAVQGAEAVRFVATLLGSGLQRG